MIYKTEEEFLKAYDSNKYEKLSLTTDILVLSVSDEEVNNYRKTPTKHMSVLLVKRNDYPYKSKWCLPGGFIAIDEDIEDCPIRILRNETNLHDIYLEQLYTFGDVNRDPRMRVISTSYMALIDKNRLDYKLSNSASWFNISYEERDNVVTVYLDNGSTRLSFIVKKVLKELTTDRYRLEIVENDSIAFDHPLVILTGIERLKNKISYTDVVFNMMPEYFTLGELQQVYEVILGKKLLDPAFRRIIADKVEKTEFVRTGAGHRPAILFKYKKK